LRAQVAIVILVATATEYTASGLLGVYTYRLHNIPWFVPPGHGLLSTSFNLVKLAYQIAIFR